MDLKTWLENIHEKYFIELKKANELPKSFWETYSSFCNTAGGVIVLGVAEGNPKNEIQGVGNPDKIITSLWDQLSNHNKVSFRNVNNDDVKQYVIDGKTIIIVNVKEAVESVKPVHINGKLENAWIRTGDGDRKVTNGELASFIRNAQPGQDSLTAEGFTIEDLDKDSLITFKERVSKRFPKKKYIEMTDEMFLTEIGACVRNRKTGELGIKRGTLLFLGKVNSIKELYHHYHLDYFNRRGNNPRWADRVSDDEPSDYEMNIYNFYLIVYEKIKTLLQESFSLDSEELRPPVSNYDETIRESLINCLAHADYAQGYPSTKIDVDDGWFSCVNPGKMLISKEQFAIGGESRPRNEVIMKLFRLLGTSERQGFGGPLIYKTALQYDFRRPEVITDIEHTELHIWNIDLADSHPELEDEEKRVLRLIAKGHQAFSVNEIRKNLKLSEYRVRKSVQVLEDKKLVRKIGKGPSTKYIIEPESMEFLTQLQVIMDMLKKQMA